MNYINMWAGVIKPKKQSVSISPEYIKLEKLQDETLMALVFGYIDPLVKKLFIISAPTERKELFTLFNQKNIYLEQDKNSNFIIHN